MERSSDFSCTKIGIIFIEQPVNAIAIYNQPSQEIGAFGRLTKQHHGPSRDFVHA